MLCDHCEKRLRNKPELEYRDHAPEHHDFIPLKPSSVKLDTQQVCRTPRARPRTSQRRKRETSAVELMLFIKELIRAS